jgi:outer membrane protein assembly factor BamB
MERILRIMYCFFGLAALISNPGPAAERVPPLGHPDYYPSPDRPIGWRGDGTGAWPGADVVTAWNAETGDNIVWCAPMPAPSFAQPIVVGEKVFTMADPTWLVRVRIHDGKVDWLVWEPWGERNAGAWNAGAIGTRFCPSPLLMDGRLIVNHNGELRVYDAETGKKLWSKGYLWCIGDPKQPFPAPAHLK